MTTKRKPTDYAGRLALSFIGIRQEYHDAIAATGELPPDLQGEYTVLHRLNMLERQVETVVVMAQAIVALAGVDTEVWEKAVEMVIAAREKRTAAGSPEAGSLQSQAEPEPQP